MPLGEYAARGIKGLSVAVFLFQNSSTFLLDFPRKEALLRLRGVSGPAGRKR